MSAANIHEVIYGRCFFLSIAHGNVHRNDMWTSFNILFSLPDARNQRQRFWFFRKLKLWSSIKRWRYKTITSDNKSLNKINSKILSFTTFVISLKPFALVKTDKNDSFLISLHRSSSKMMNLLMFLSSQQILFMLFMFIYLLPRLEQDATWHSLLFMTRS